jgi:hypothetical protein
VPVIHHVHAEHAARCHTSGSCSWCRVDMFPCTTCPSHPHPPDSIWRGVAPGSCLCSRLHWQRPEPPPCPVQPPCCRCSQPTTAAARWPADPDQRSRTGSMAHAPAAVPGNTAATAPPHSVLTEDSRLWPQTSLGVLRALAGACWCGFLNRHSSRCTPTCLASSSSSSRRRCLCWWVEPLFL